MKIALDEIMTTYAKDALRTIGLAYKDLSEGEGGSDHSQMTPEGDGMIEMSGGLVFLGIFGIQDVIRDEVPGAVDACHKAGITVRMVTGDNLITAIAIAKNCHIIKEDISEDELQQCSMEGPQFNEYVGGLVLVCKECKRESCVCKEQNKENNQRDTENDKEKAKAFSKDTTKDKDSKDKEKNKDKVESVRFKDKFESIMNTLFVVARSRPEDKYLLVTALRE